MTDPAIIKGTFSDLKFIKSRKVVQVLVEVPIEAGPQVVAAFGTPDPSKETWVALARLTEDAVKQTGVQKADKPKGGRLAQMAGILCNEPGFRRFLEHILFFKIGDTDVLDPDMAADEVRIRCGVTSRAELDTNDEAGKRFLDLVADYELWLKDVAA